MTPPGCAQMHKFPLLDDMRFPGWSLVKIQNRKKEETVKGIPWRSSG